MLRRLFISAAVISLVGGSALAANSSVGGTNQNSSAQPAQTNQNLPKEIRSKLEQDGFSNVRIVPGSFIVSAKDKNGDPVTMVIGPNSMMMLTEVPGTTNSTTGSGSAGSANTSSGSK